MNFLMTLLLFGGIAVGAYFLIRYKKNEKKELDKFMYECSPEGKKEAEERKKKEKAEKKEQERQEQLQREEDCRKNGHDYFDLTNENLSYANVESLQMDHRGYQRQRCRHCGAIRVTDKRLAEINAPELPEEYKENIIWQVDDDQVVAGTYTIKIDPAKTCYLYLTKSINEDLRRGSVLAYIGFAEDDDYHAIETAEKNDEFPKFGKLKTSIEVYDDHDDLLIAKEYVCNSEERPLKIEGEATYENALKAVMERDRFVVIPYQDYVRKLCVRAEVVTE